MGKVKPSDGRVTVSGKVKIHRKDGTIEEIELDDISVEQSLNVKQSWFRRNK